MRQRSRRRSLSPLPFALVLRPRHFSQRNSGDSDHRGIRGMPRAPRSGLKRRRENGSHSLGEKEQRRRRRRSFFCVALAIRRHTRGSKLLSLGRPWLFAFQVSRSLPLSLPFKKRGLATRPHGGKEGKKLVFRPCFEHENVFG